jgi:hypothetical protein
MSYRKLEKDTEGKERSIFLVIEKAARLVRQRLIRQPLNLEGQTLRLERFLGEGRFLELLRINLNTP